MDALSIFLAKLIGIYFIILGIVLVFKHKTYHECVREVGQSHFKMVFSSVFVLLVGLAIILGHNLWVESWPVVITIIGWIFFIVGVVRLFFHNTIMHMLANSEMHLATFIIVGVIFFLVGLFLGYEGFFASHHIMPH